MRADADQQRLHDRDRADDPRARRRRVRRRSARRARRAPSLFSISGNVEQPGQLRARARHLDARADLHARAAGSPDGRAAEGGHPGRLVGAGADRAADRRAARLRLAGRDRDVLRRRRADRGRRPLLHGAARAALDEVLHARVLRQVHAVPRGDALAGAAPGEARGAATPSTTTSTCCARSATASTASRLCALGDFAVWPGAELLRQVARGVRRATSSRAAARSAASRRSRASSRRPTSTPTSPGRGGARHEHARSSSPSRSTAARCRCRRASGSSRRRSRRGSRSRSSATSRGSARRSAPAACASSRSRACRSSRPAAR